MRLILASNSPRRKELLRRDGFTFTVMKSNAKEAIRYFKSFIILVFENKVNGQYKKYKCSRR